MTLKWQKKPTIRIYDFLVAQHHVQRERTIVCSCLFALNIHPFPYRVFTWSLIYFSHRAQFTSELALMECKLNHEAWKSKHSPDSWDLGPHSLRLSSDVEVCCRFFLLMLWLLVAISLNPSWHLIVFLFGETFKAVSAAISSFKTQSCLG